VRADQPVLCADGQVKEPQSIVGAPVQVGHQLCEASRIDGAGDVRSPQPFGIGRRRDLHSNARQQREAAAKGRHPGKPVQVAKGAVDRLCATHGEAGDGTMVPVGQRPIVAIHIRDDIGNDAFGKIEDVGAWRRPLPTRGDRHIVRRSGQAAVAVGHHHNHGSRLALSDQVIQDVWCPPEIAPPILVVPTPVEQVEHRKALVAIFIARRRVDGHPPGKPQARRRIPHLAQRAVRDIVHVV